LPMSDPFSTSPANSARTAFFLFSMSSCGQLRYRELQLTLPMRTVTARLRRVVSLAFVGCCQLA
jgi:hypothetical protein